ncbi:hypothetical protein GCM10009087_12930 [Sphingomonas oligophenolica]
MEPLRHEPHSRLAFSSAEIAGQCVWGMPPDTLASPQLTIMGPDSFARSRTAWALSYSTSLPFIVPLSLISLTSRPTAND